MRDVLAIACFALSGFAPSGGLVRLAAGSCSRGSASAAVLLPPTVLMGGTLPLFCRQYVVQPTRVADYLDDSLDPEERAAIRALRAQDLGDIAAYALSRRAQALAGGGNNEQRIGLLRQAAGRNGENFLANRLLVETFANVGRLEEAHRFYRQAVRLEPNNTRARRGLARTNKALRENDGARPMEGAQMAEPR